MHAKIAITIDEDVLENLDELVSNRVFKSRSQAIEESVKAQLLHFSRANLIRECRKLDMNEERAMADEGLAEDLQEWPTY